MSHKMIESLPKNETDITAEKQFLRFYLEPETNIMLPIEQVTEVLKLSLKKIVPIPQMPSWVMGIYNWRGEIIWTIDLGHLLGLKPWQEQGINPSYATALILSTSDAARGKNSSKNSFGLIINRVEDIEWCSPDRIQPPPPSAVDSNLAPFIEGYWLKMKQEMILVLDGKSLTNEMN